jgi:hypothetical protein
MLTLTASQQALVAATSKSAFWRFNITDKNGVKYCHGGLPPNLLDENCSVITDWSDGDFDTAVSERLIPQDSFGLIRMQEQQGMPTLIDIEIYLDPRIVLRLK